MSSVAHRLGGSGIMFYTCLSVCGCMRMGMTAEAVFDRLAVEKNMFCWLHGPVIKIVTLSLLNAY